MRLAVPSCTWAILGRASFKPTTMSSMSAVAVPLILMSAVGG